MSSGKSRIPVNIFLKIRQKDGEYKVNPDFGLERAYKLK
jgi:hypothetical protein